jgi:hypothetical protein
VAGDSPAADKARTDCHCNNDQTINLNKGAAVAIRSLHPFPARMAPEIALSAIPKRTDAPLTILDPMCGSGTVLGVALARGQHAVGEDIDPLAVMMSTLAVTPVDTYLLENEVTRVVQEARVSEGRAPWQDDRETEDFVDFWFGPQQKRQLIALTYAIDSALDPTLKLALRLAVSRIIVTKSPKASLAADTSHSRPHRVRETSDYDVLDGFEQSTRQLVRSLNARELNGVGRVSLGDARVLESIPDGTADLAVTSPPYLNALDYLRGHKLALVWFGYTIKELRHRRGISIGAERALAGDASQATTAIVDAIISGASEPAALKIPMLERFATDCIAFSQQLHRTLKPGAKAILVVGNSTLRGNYIRNDLIARYALEQSGFRFLDQRNREIPPSQRYMAINTSSASSSMAKRMRTEVVLTMRRDIV